MKLLKLGKHFRRNIGRPHKPLVHLNNGIFLFSLIRVPKIVHNSAVYMLDTMFISLKVQRLAHFITMKQQEAWKNGRTYPCVSHGTSDGLPSFKSHGERYKVYCCVNEACEHDGWRRNTLLPSQRLKSGHPLKSSCFATSMQGFGSKFSSLCKSLAHIMVFASIKFTLVIGL